MRNLVATMGLMGPMGAALLGVWLERPAGSHTARAVESEQQPVPNRAAIADHPSPSPRIPQENGSGSLAARQRTPSPRAPSPGRAADKTRATKPSGVRADELPNQPRETRSSPSLSPVQDRDAVPVVDKCRLDVSVVERKAYLGTFIEVPVPVSESGSDSEVIANLRVAPGVPSYFVEVAIRSLKAAVRRGAQFARGVPAPLVYVHANAEDMKRHACVADSAVSYYAGAIHITAVLEPSVLEQLLHEYAHHILKSMGIDRPIWLHEGFAQYFSGEARRARPTFRSTLELGVMARPLSTTSSAEDVATFYQQASDMFVFLLRLSPGQEQHEVVRLVSQLTTALLGGVVNPDSLFVWGIEARGDHLFHGSPTAFWEDYVRRGGFSRGETRDR